MGKPGLKCIQRQKCEKKERHFKIAALDIETFGDANTNGLLGDFVYGTLYYEGDSEPTGYTDVGSLIDAMLEREIAHQDKYRVKFSGTRIYVHNLEFDFTRFVKHFVLNGKYDLELAERAEGVVYKVVVKSGGRRVLEIYDSLAVYGGSLKEFAKAFGGEFFKLEHDHTKTFDVNNTDHIAYAMMDVRVLVECMSNFDKTLYAFFMVHVKGTISSTAFAAFQRFIPEGMRLFPQNRKEAEKFERGAYYGGSVLLNFKPHDRIDGVYVFDVNSEYPFCLKRPYPIGTPAGTSRYVEGKLGFYNVNVYIPEDFALPGIPMRSKAGVIYHKGYFRTQLASPEIEYWRSHQGVTIEVIDGYYYHGTCRPFDEFVNLCERLRAEYKLLGDVATETVIKLMQNSLYGKFGTKPEGKRELVVTANAPGDDWVHMLDKCGDLVDYVYCREKRIDAVYMIPAIAALCTSYARVLLNSYIDIAGRENTHYTDTDSIHTNKEGCERLMGFKENVVGKAYGQLKLENKTLDGESIIYVAPKVYENVTRGYLKAKGMGAAIKENGIKHLSEIEGQLPYTSTSSIETFLKTGSYGGTRKRSLSDPKNVVSHSLDSNGYFVGVPSQFTVANCDVREIKDELFLTDMCVNLPLVDPDDLYGRSLGFDDDVVPRGTAANHYALN